MAAGPFVPGPAHVAVGLGFSRSLAYLGRTRRGVRSAERLFSRPVQADLAGTLGMPADVLLSGKILVFTMELVYWDPAVMELVKGRYFGGLAGTIQAGEIGSLLLAEGLDFEVALLSQYQGLKSIYSANKPGLHAYHCWCSESIDANHSTEEQTWNLTFTAIPKLNPTTLVGTFYDYNVSSFPPIT
jgi:hypothetical protein